MPEISIKAETLASIFGFHFTNSLLLSFLGLGIIFALGYLYHKQVRTYHKSGIFYILQTLLKSLYTLFGSILKDHTDTFFPLMAAFFLWVLIQNWIGLLPGVGSILVAVKEEGHVLHIPLFRGNNADINATLALAMVSVILIQISGLKYLGIEYVKKFINFSNPINFFVGILEIVGEFSKIISFAFRLFGNIFAGEVLMTIIAFLIPVLAPFPFLLLEIFVGFIQALVFSMLTAVFLSSAIAKHH